MMKDTQDLYSREFKTLLSFIKGNLNKYIDLHFVVKISNSLKLRHLFIL